MLTETTVSKLREMRLSVMANALKDQLSDPQFQNMTFEDRIGLLVDAEWEYPKEQPPEQADPAGYNYRQAASNLERISRKSAGSRSLHSCFRSVGTP